MTTYSSDPLCRACSHPQVVHKGERHNGRCIAVNCGCQKFMGRVG